jgi:molybdate transport system substrate-binding protein
MNTILRLLTPLPLFALGLALPLRAATVTVFAAASLTDVLKEIGHDYEAKSGDKVAFNLAGSNVLARQIEQGARADIFLSADEAQMNAVAQAGLIDPATRADLLRNTLVIVAPADSPLANFIPPDLAKVDIQRIALADPKAVPAGIYAKQYLTNLGLWSKVEGKVVPTANVRAALAAVESGDVEAGIVYQTDASSTRKVKVIYAVPLSDGPRITYPVALMKASDGADAKKFLAYLESPAARAIFQKYGFIPGGK